jgi:hypothetical protein
MDDRILLGAGAQKLRSLLAARSDPDALGAYNTLWSLEFKARPPSEYEALRKQVAADPAELRSRNLLNTRQWYEALEAGYKLVSDQKQADWAKGERSRRFPQLWEFSAVDEWTRAHPWPKSDDPADKKRAYYNELFKQAGEWLKERPVRP